MAVTNYYSVGGEILGEKTTGGSRIDYLTDALGSVTATLNQSAQVVNTYRYKPYGSQLAKTGTAPDPSFTWVGSQGYRQTNKEYSDVYVRARHYSAVISRWISTDRIETLAPLYTYVRCNPIGLIDPSGWIPRILNPGSCINFPKFNLSDCCRNLSQRTMDKTYIPKLLKCMSKLGFNSEDQQMAIQRALTWLGNACTDNNITVCVTCNNTDNPFPPPYWPSKETGCPYSCSEPLASTLLPYPDPVKLPPGTPIMHPIPTDGIGCPPFNGLKKCEGLRNPLTGVHCDASILMCGPFLPEQECGVFMHELIHAGGVGGGIGKHRQIKGNPGIDFTYALACCLCGLSGVPRFTGCDNECADFDAWKSDPSHAKLFE